MTNILIVVRGGVQDVYSDNECLNVTLVDYDDIEGGRTDPFEFDNYPVKFVDVSSMDEVIENANKEIEYNNSL